MSQTFVVLRFGFANNRSALELRISYRLLAVCSAFLLAIVVSATLLFSSYLHMSWKLVQYNRLAQDFDRLRGRYQELRQVSNQHNEQIASLENLATQVSVSYGLSERGLGTASMDTTEPLNPNVQESLEEYNFLKAASFGEIYRRSTHRWQAHSRPSLWPMDGVVRSAFGGRLDPFSGEGAFHTGIDVAATTGTPVRATADGVVRSAGWAGGYGKMVVIDHSDGIQTYYAHLSRLAVIAGQEVRGSQLIGYSGSTGHSTGPHVHYEVRLAGTPVNPAKYLPRADRSPDHASEHRLAKIVSHSPTYNDLGL